MKIVVINGPNLNLLGTRERSIYGDTSFESYYRKLCNQFESVEFSYFQSNHEGDLIDKIHETGFSADGIILNAGAYVITSYSIHYTKLYENSTRLLNFPLMARRKISASAKSRPAKW